MNRKRPLDPNFLKELFRYENGKLFWLKRPINHFHRNGDCIYWNSRFSNKEAGYISSEKNSARVIISVGHVQYYRSILIWTLVNNKWPENEIDHKNMNSLDDKIENLREATRSLNIANRKIRKDNRSGFKGVSMDKKRYRARININGKEKIIGYFDDPILAHEAYKKAAKQHFGEFARFE